jgi:hypothetical protein
VRICNDELVIETGAAPIKFCCMEPAGHDLPHRRGGTEWQDKTLTYRIQFPRLIVQRKDIGGGDHWKPFFVLGRICDNGILIGGDLRIPGLHVALFWRRLLS